MLLSTREIDITPTRPCWQGGYVQRTEYYHKVNDPIMATIFVPNFEGVKMVWISMDISGVQQIFADAVISKVRESGIVLERKDIVFGATHTHSGPLIGTYRDREMDEEYFESTVNKVANAIIQAWNDEGIEVSARYSSAQIDGLYSNRNDKNKLSDKTVSMIGFFKDEELIALYYTMAHHCTVLGPNFMDLSADLFGRLRYELKKELGDIPVLMVQGNAGDMGNKQYRRANIYSEVEYQAFNVMDQIRKKHTPWETIELSSLEYYEGSYKAIFDIETAPLKVKKAQFEKQLETETDFDTIKLLKTGISSYERKIAAGDMHVERDMTYRIFRLNDIEFVCIPGELGSILGMRIKDASKFKHCILWGYVDPQNLGYMIEKEAYSGFSQEANVTDYPAGIPDEYAAEIIKHL